MEVLFVPARPSSRACQAAAFIDGSWSIRVSNSNTRALRAPLGTGGRIRTARLGSTPGAHPLWFFSWDA